MDTINVMLDKYAFMPERAFEWDAGLDIRSPWFVRIAPRDSVIINSGVHVEIPPGYVGLLKSKSGLNVNHGITSEGVIDAGFTGSITVKLYNHTDDPYDVYVGDKITQLVISPVALPEPVQVAEFAETERGSNGIGSTGK